MKTVLQTALTGAKISLYRAIQATCQDEPRVIHRNMEVILTEHFETGQYFPQGKKMVSANFVLLLKQNFFSIRSGS